MFAVLVAVFVSLLAVIILSFAAYGVSVFSMLCREKYQKNPVGSWSEAWNTVKSQWDNHVVGPVNDDDRFLSAFELDDEDKEYDFDFLDWAEQDYIFPNQKMEDDTRPKPRASASKKTKKTKTTKAPKTPRTRKPKTSRQ